MINKLREKEGRIRIKKIINFVPKDVKKVFDIGCKYNIFRKYDLITLDMKGNPDITQNLNLNQKIPLKNNMVDLVVLNQVLEHLSDPRELIREAKRISKKYIFVGLPNELTYANRLKYFFGIPRNAGFRPFGHKHFFVPNEIEKFVKESFGEYQKKDFWFCGTGGFLLPNFLQDFLAKNLPNLFAGEIYYMIKVKK